ncbi:TPA_asm: P3 [Zea alphacytorhabdovirus 1]|nr:TPA_asm: P3 [Zea alphacytorhabdovirus 1]
MAFIFDKLGTFSYCVKTELITGTENNVVPLTKTLNLYQKMRFSKADNIRIKRLKVTYKPRTGTLGKGRIEAWVKDNRIDSETDDAIINRCVFGAEENATITWESCVWLAKCDLGNLENPPLVFEMELTECNMTAGYSIGRVHIVVEITASETMDRFIFRAPTLIVGNDPLAIKGVTHGSSFITKRKDAKMIGVSSDNSTPKLLGQAHEAPERVRLRSVAQDTIRSHSARYLPRRLNSIRSSD